ncbi:hypothetical protein quinque_008769 [Culex quinquefasciatus]
MKWKQNWILIFKQLLKPLSTTKHTLIIGHVMNIQSMYKEITRAFKFKTLLILCAIYGYNFLQNNPLHYYSLDVLSFA